MNPPSQKRQRVPLACNRCRKLKVKCSGDFPCTKCKKLGIPCSFAPEFREPPKAAVVAKPTVEVADSHDPIGCVIQWRIYARAQLLLVRELCKTNMELLPPEKRALLKVPRMHNYGWNMSGLHYVPPPAFPERPHHDFGSSHLELLRYFFSEINPLYCVLPREFLAFFTKSYSQFMVAASHPSLRLKNDVNLHMATLYLVFALSLRFTEFSRPEGPSDAMLQVETACFAYAREVVETILAEYFSLELLQAWMLVIIYLRTAYNQRALIKAIDLANCMARTMGLHERRVVFTKPEATRKRALHVFWTVYTLDQVFSVQIGRPSFWRNSDISVPRPEDTNEFWLASRTPLDQYAMFKIALVAHDVQHARWHPEDSDTGAVAEKIDSLHTWLAGMGLVDVSGRNEEAGNKEGGNKEGRSKESGGNHETEDVSLGGSGFGSSGTNASSTPLAKDDFSEFSSSASFPTSGASVLPPFSFPSLTQKEGTLSGPRTQVALHFYDVVFSFHSPVLLGLFGKPAPPHGLVSSTVFQYMEEAVLLVSSTISTGAARTPWYNTLTVLFGAGTMALVLANSGLHGNLPRRIYTAAINELRTIGNYRNSEGVLLYPMAKECVWAITQGLQSMKGRFEHEARLIDEIDTGDHTGYLNEANFGLMGRYQDYQRDELPKLEEYNPDERKSKRKRRSDGENSGAGENEKNEKNGNNKRNIDENNNVKSDEKNDDNYENNDYGILGNSQNEYSASDETKNDQFEDSAGKEYEANDTEMSGLLSVDEMVRQLTTGSWLDTMDLLDPDVMNFVEFG